MTNFKCCLCGKDTAGWGNNPYPLCDEKDFESRCCDECNDTYVIPARILNCKSVEELKDKIRVYIESVWKV